MKLKVCGMRNAQNITELIKVQPHFIGFIFHKNSPRNVTEIPHVAIPKSIKKVGVFVDESFDFILEKAIAFNLDYIQLHGNETPKFCSELLSLLEEGLREVNLKIIKAFNISENFNFEQLNAYNPYCDYFLFDAFGKKVGGNSITFNWNLLNNYKGEIPFLLSGGINETMIGEIKKINHQKFAGIDINSGFETAPALKNIEKIRKFYKTLRQ